MTNPVVAIAHPDNAFAGAYQLKLTACGRLIAIGRDPLRALASRLAEEGYPPSTILKVRSHDGRTPDIDGSIEGALA